jgi:hypothetical protein
MNGEIERNYLQERMDAILRKDENIYYRMYQLAQGQQINAMLAQKVLDKITQPRVLDTPPKVMKMNKKGGIPSGCKELFKHSYNGVIIEEQAEGEIDFAGNIIICEIEVIKVLKAILKISTGPNIDMVDACKQIVSRIIMLGSLGYKITKESMLGALNIEGYYGMELSEAIKEVSGFYPKDPLEDIENLVNE